MNLTLIAGARPNFMKIAPIIHAIQKAQQGGINIHYRLVHTGQHYDVNMSEMFFEELDIPRPDVNLGCGGGTQAEQTAAIMIAFEKDLMANPTDLVIVVGDVTSTMACSIVAKKMNTKVAHVEAGIRSWDLTMPEEINRQITGRIATYNFAPTPLSKQNLLDEGVNESSITVTGNTVIDALNMVVKKIKSNHNLQNDIKDTLLQSGLPERMVRAFFQPLVTNRRLVLITGHRRENFGNGFLHICEAIKTLAEKYPDVDFVYPMHLNPNVRKPIKEIFGDWVSNRQSSNSNLYFIEPLEYLPFVFLMEQSTLVLTDSGGIQEEAPGLGKPVLVMRNTTERPEAVEAGTVKLVGTNYDLIVSEVSKLLDDPAYYNAMAQATNPYGDGLASKRIIEFLKL